MTGSRSERFTAIDALRGVIMVIMALDHVREFFHADAARFAADLLAKTTPFLFFTRWITHFCAPVFVFTAGVGAFFRLQHTGSKAVTSRFLWTRGLWLIFVELSIMRLGFNFTFAANYPFLLLTLWALGASMIALAILVYLPARAVGAIGLLVIALHNLLDGISARSFGEFGFLWNLVHQPGLLTAKELAIVVGYPVLAWIGVMAAGFGFGSILLIEPEARRRSCAAIGASLIALFFIVRAVNMYGDPSPWSSQSSPMFTLLSFFRVTKNPPSLEFVLMTLGPALVLLSILDRAKLPFDNPLVVFGRVPLFYYVVHFWLIHIVSSAMSFARYGSASLSFLMSPLPSMFGERTLFPADFGYPLWVTYVVWVGIVLAMYPMCRRYAAFKASSRQWWLSYL